jgi:methylated-DNA-[protein]-cysteine S-methyltransferase
MATATFSAAKSIVVFKTALGWIALDVGPHGVRGLTFGHPDAAAARAAMAKILKHLKDASSDDEAADDDLISDLADQLKRFADSEPVNFDDVPLDMESLSNFQRKVLVACRRIPYGQTSTYGALAAAAGSPGAARAVGRAMATNRWPLIVPCHRVLASGGRLGGYSARGGLTTKQRLLDMERAR